MSTCTVMFRMATLMQVLAALLRDRPHPRCHECVVTEPTRTSVIFSAKGAGDHHPLELGFDDLECVDGHALPLSLYELIQSRA